MPSDALTSKEQTSIKECLRAIAYGPFLDDLEFETLMGLSREEVRKIAEDYPEVDEYDSAPGECDDSRQAINNAIVNLLEFSKKQEWSEFVSITPGELEVIFEKWKR